MPSGRGRSDGIKDSGNRHGLCPRTATTVPQAPDPNGNQWLPSSLDVAYGCIMTTSLPNLDDVIRHVRDLHPRGSELERVQDAVDVASSLNELGDHLVGHFIDEARTAGASWAAIGEHLGLSRQAVQKRYAPQPDRDEEPPRSPKFFDRMIPEGKFVIVHAQEEARRRQASYIGTEHILLGIVAEPEATGAKALSKCGATPEVITAAINGRIGLPTGEPRTDKLPFTPAGKSVLEHSLRESLRLGHDYIGTEHLALACFTVSQGMVSELLGNLGVSYDKLREAVTSLTAAKAG